jgi:IS605 OrfB family transposase
MNRTLKISLNQITQTKSRKLQTLRHELRHAIQFYINSLWLNPGALDAQTLNRYIEGSLSYRHRQNALKIALELLIANNKAARALGTYPRKPILTGKAITLSCLVAKVEKGKKSFDYVLKISGLSKGHPIVIPFKSHKRLNYWLNQPGTKFRQGCTLGDTWAGLWIEVPTPEKKDGPTLGIDIGLNKLIVDSNGIQYGTEIKKIVQSIKRKKPGSKARAQAHRHRENYINKVVKSLPWDSIGTLGMENLKDMKKGKKKNRSKKFRKAMAPWTYRQVMTRIPQLAQENRVRLVLVDPRDTSRTCPSCGSVARENRRGEAFRCVICNYSADADYVGAQNVLVRTLGNSQESMVPELLCAVS